MAKKQKTKFTRNKNLCQSPSYEDLYGSLDENRSLINKYPSNFTIINTETLLQFLNRTKINICI